MVSRSFDKRSKKNLCKSLMLLALLKFSSNIRFEYHLCGKVCHKTEAGKSLLFGYYITLYF